MKKTILSGLWVLLLLTGCAPYLQDLPVHLCEPLPENGSTSYTRGGAIGAAVQGLVKEGVPGAAVAVYSAEGWWTTAAGFAKLEDRTSMQPCHLQYLQSISKLYLAVAVLKLYEAGKLRLDEPITAYLPERYRRYVTGAGQITVRMLLNHTSGVAEYNFSPAYVTYLLQHPDHRFTTEEYLAYIEGEPLDFAPGSQYSYRNTNYILLALLTDALTGDHARYLTETIFTPLGLTQTYYRGQAGYPDYPALVNAYWDRYGNGIVENVSQMQKTNVASLIGDDGIVATPADAVKFLRGLMEGKLLSAATMDEMKTWVNNRKGEPAYGLGLAYATVHGQVAYGHTGGGLGAGCQLYYFPEKGVYVFIGINLGTVTDSPLHKGAERALDGVMEALLE
ncbi:MAG: beta-lactamase family protein [Cytophagales bacterium]|nr:beta-lactamase family protein [Cytophagales bacterium]